MPKQKDPLVGKLAKPTLTTLGKLIPAWRLITMAMLLRQSRQSNDLCGVLGTVSVPERRERVCWCCPEVGCK